MSKTAQAKHAQFTRLYYEQSELDRIAIRSAYGDAAHMCNAIAADIEREHTSRGKITNRGKEIAAAVLRAGNAIWAMRELVSAATPPDAAREEGE